MRAPASSWASAIADGACPLFPARLPALCCSVAALHQDLEACALLANKKGKPLLASLGGGKSSEDGRLLLQAVVSHTGGS